MQQIILLQYHLKLNHEVHDEAEEEDDHHQKKIVVQTETIQVVITMANVEINRKYLHEVRLHEVFMDQQLVHDDYSIEW
jgi:hypothetical protein